MQDPLRPETADTIVALATPPGHGALGTVRFSGPRATHLARQLFRPWKQEDPFPAPRQAISGTALGLPRREDGIGQEENGIGKAEIRAQPGRGESGHGSSGRAALGPATDAAVPLDQGVLVFFPAADSPTGEDLVEITLHGSPMVLALFLDAAQARGARPAQPGEFSYRAFLNGRLDAAQAEAIGDLVRARTAQQARVAHRQQTGALARAMEPARQELVDWLARLEGSIEFAATENEDFLDRSALATGLERIATTLGGLLQQSARGLTLARGVRVVLAGQVNAGKSSLFNAWLEQERAIVHHQPGTTRDLLEAEVDWDGLPVTLMDSAGERQALSASAGGELDPVEQEGQRRGAAARHEADLVIWLLDGAADQPLWPPPAAAGEAPRLVAVSKGDLKPAPTVDPAHAEDLSPVRHGQATEGDLSPLPVFSARSGSGLEELKHTALALLAPGWDRRERPLITRLRQKGCLQRAVAALDEGRELVAGGAGEEMIVLPLGQVLAELARLTGRGDLEEVYDRIFSRFCIGK